jgi:hypothetical protein
MTNYALQTGEQWAIDAGETSQELKAAEKVAKAGQKLVSSLITELLKIDFVEEAFSKQNIDLLCLDSGDFREIAYEILEAAVNYKLTIIE